MPDQPENTSDQTGAKPVDGLTRPPEAVTSQGFPSSSSGFEEAGRVEEARKAEAARELPSEAKPDAAPDTAQQSAPAVETQPEGPITTEAVTAPPTPVEAPALPSEETARQAVEAALRDAQAAPAPEVAPASGPAPVQERPIAIVPARVPGEPEISPAPAEPPAPAPVEPPTPAPKRGGIMGAFDRLRGK